MEKRILTLISKKIGNTNRRHKLDKGDVIEVLGDESGTIQTTKSSIDGKIQIRYYKDYNFITLPITYIEV